MGGNFRRLDAIRVILREPIRPSEPTLAEPSALLADPALAARVRVYLVCDQPVDPLSCEPVSVRRREVEDLARRSRSFLRRGFAASAGDRFVRADAPRLSPEPPIPKLFRGVQVFR